MAHIGDLGDLRFHDWGTLVVGAARETREGGALLGVVAELMAEDAEGGGGVAKTTGDIGGRRSS
jgi:hypothetical protein